MVKLKKKYFTLLKYLKSVNVFTAGGGRQLADHSFQPNRRDVSELFLV